MAQSVGAVALDIVVGKETVSSAVQKVANEAQRSFGSASGKIASMNKVLDKTQSELTDVDRLLQLDPKNTILLEQKQRLLGSSISQTKSKLTELKSSAESANAALAKGDISQEKYDKLQREIIETEQDLKALEKQTKSNSNAFSKFKSAMGGIGKACLAVGKVTAVGLGVASTAVIGLGKQAVDAYGQYEQLVGGVETLFKENASTVIKNASNAYKTAGMSANAYMETVTSFSASLLQSVGGDTVKAAEMADMAVTDMSDNANKMGTSMEMIQNAYQGFAKQNYTMLDNLKLGYGGTKSEMERLLADAQAISGIQYDISSYADVVDAIHVIQTEMGITGTTAKEASSTIQGSISAMGSAWTNLITGLADPTQNLDQLINNFVDSVITVGDNLIPRISMILESITKLISSLAPKLVAEIPNIVSQLLPSIIQGAVSIINAIVQTLPQLIDTIVGMLPQFLSGIQQIFTGIIEALPSLMQTLVSQLPTLIPMIIDGAVEMFVMLANSFGEIIQPIIDNLPEIIMSITNALLENLPALIEGCVNLIVALVGAMPQITMSLIQCIPQIITNIVKALFSAMPILLQGIGTIFGNAWKTIVNIFSGAGKFFGNLFSEAVNIIQSVFGKIVGFFSGVWSKITGIFKRIGEVVGKAITNVVSKAVNGILSTACSIINGFISAINFAIGLINAIPGVNISKLNKLSVPQLEQGGVLKRGQVGLLEGNGAEAVVPLEKNTGWLTRIADMLDERMSGRGALITPPTLENVRAGNRAENTTNSQSKIDELIELVKMLVDRDTDTTVPIYIGNELIDEYILNKNSRAVLRSGGRA